MSAHYEALYPAILAGQPAAVTWDVDGVSYVRNFLPKERLILLGGGHIAQPLCRYGAELGFAVTVVDDRPAFANRTRFPEAAEIVCNAFPAALQALDIRPADYVAVITRGHRYDADCLRVILAGTMPKYLGMIGSRRRVAGLFALLRNEGFSPAALERVHAPIGLAINALTTQEIAVSIAAELIQCRRRETPRRSGSTTLVSEDIDLSLLQALSRQSTPQALLVVLETSGSTPVKSGAMMVVDRLGLTAGTIGGGCSEHAVLTEARRLIGTHTRKCVDVDMSNDVAEMEGMVCGGRMRVLIEDISPNNGETEARS